MLIPTLRDNPSDADIKSHQLLLRAGFIRQNAAGVSEFSSVRKSCVKKSRTHRTGRKRCALEHKNYSSSIQPAELWKSQEDGQIMALIMSLKDRHDRRFCFRCYS